MTQREIDDAVALATGEELSEVQHLGFGLADPDDTEFDPEPSVPPLSPVRGGAGEVARRSGRRRDAIAA